MESEEKFNPGDLVTLNGKGLAHFETRRFPAQVGAVYVSILEGNMKVLRTEGEVVRLTYIKPRFPVTESGKNEVGVPAGHLRVRCGKT